jgi:hypothetical protein
MVAARDPAAARSLPMILEPEGKFFQSINLSLIFNVAVLHFFTYADDLTTY